jgi:hypothetical protein
MIASEWRLLYHNALQSLDDVLHFPKGRMRMESAGEPGGGQ